ncbi:sensor histidine kinase [Hoyosella sp. G463]|uniref:histidine kinase n=1 Tax=Lolliginicoccus lacisalsi TaxID=2742202 RepID=A0A927JC42_9ACTN|nr:sensor histidine kinase [Lolliginicoccus lacisalsi]MBD8506588.1 sensor histidine kinase [Lolliginicoccus lacisalsi]
MAPAPASPRDQRRAGAGLVERWFRFTRARWLGIDIAIAAVVTLAALASQSGLFTGPHEVVLALLMTVPLAWRRLRPAWSGFTIAAAAYLHLLIFQDSTSAGLGVLFAVYGLAAYAGPWASRIAWPLAALGVGVSAYLSAAEFDREPRSAAINIVSVVALTTVVYLFGLIRRFRINEVSGLTERARLLELEREQETKLAAITERTRIAREMHDIVAHSLTVVIAQADGGRYAARASPEAATEALEQISATGRQALTDMRALLSVLRDGSPRETGSTPSAEDIPALIEDMRRSGLDVELVIDGEAREVPAGPSLTAYRIVQESLTNVLKHAGPRARVTVAIEWTDTALRLRITDDGQGLAGILPRPETAGQGVRGMQERASLYGGDVTAGPLDGSGYEVTARLPLASPR